MSEWGGGAPAYLQVADDLRTRIETGQLKPGDTLPSVAAIMREYETSNTTAQAAIRVLKAAGLVESQRGKGVFVRRVQRAISRSANYTSPPADGEPVKYHGTSEQLEISEIVPPDDVAIALGLEDDMRAVCRSRVMVEKDNPTSKGKVVELVASYFPVEIARGTELDSLRQIKGGTLAALKRMGYPPRNPAKEWVDARMPTARESRLLNLPPGTPVLRLLRRTCTDGDRPIEVLDMVFGADRYRLEYDLPVHE